MTLANEHSYFPYPFLPPSRPYHHRFATLSPDQFPSPTTTIATLLARVRAAPPISISDLPVRSSPR